MPHFLYQAVGSNGAPASGAMEADNAQAAHGKLVMAGYRQIQMLSDRSTTALQDDLAAMTPAERQTVAQARVKFITGKSGSDSRSMLAATARGSWLYLLCVGALALYALQAGHPLRFGALSVAFAAPFFLAYKAGDRLRDYTQLQLAMVHGEWDKAKALILRMRAKPAQSAQLAMDLDVREAQIRIRQGEPVETAIAGLQSWREKLADKPGTFSARLISLYLAAKDYPGYLRAARDSFDATPEDASRAIELATAEARFGDAAEARRLLASLTPALVTPIAANFVNWCQGMLDLREGNPAAALEPLRAAAARLEENAAKTPVAGSTLALVTGFLALALARTGKAEEARQRIAPFWPQLDLFADAGLIYDLEREVGRSPYQ